MLMGHNVLTHTHAVCGHVHAHILAHAGEVIKSTGMLWSLVLIKTESADCRFIWEMKLLFRPRASLLLHNTYTSFKVHGSSVHGLNKTKVNFLKGCKAGLLNRRKLAWDDPEFSTKPTGSFRHTQKTLSNRTIREGIAHINLLHVRADPSGECILKSNMSPARLVACLFVL